MAFGDAKEIVIADDVASTGTAEIASITNVQGGFAVEMKIDQVGAATTPAEATLYIEDSNGDRFDILTFAGPDGDGETTSRRFVFGNEVPTKIGVDYTEQSGGTSSTLRAVLIGQTIT